MVMYCRGPCLAAFVHHVNLRYTLLLLALSELPLLDAPSQYMPFSQQSVL
jgi:hypothetical protein